MQVLASHFLKKNFLLKNAIFVQRFKMLPTLTFSILSSSNSNLINFAFKADNFGRF